MPFEFKLPEIVYPGSIDTIGKEMAFGIEISMHCYECGRKDVRINLVPLAKRYGMDFPNGHDSLIEVVSCSACKAAGRPRKNIGFICHQLTAQCSAWPREDRENAGHFIFQKVGN